MRPVRYLDHAATTPLRPEARAAMAPYLDEVYGNPSGMHGAARRAKNALEAARERAASLLGAAHPLEIVFTGGVLPRATTSPSPAPSSPATPAEPSPPPSSTPPSSRPAPSCSVSAVPSGS